MFHARVWIAIAVSGILALAAPTPVQADDAPPRTQRTATVGFYVYSIRDLDLIAQRFTAEFYCWLRYRGEEDKDIERVEFANGHVLTSVEQERSVDGAERYVCWRMVGIFQMRVALEKFPFDAHRLEFMVEHPALEIDQLAYVHDEASYKRSPAPQERWGIKNGLTVPDFDVLGTELKAERFAYETDFGRVEGQSIGSTYSRLVLTVKVVRNARPYVLKFLLPLLAILAMAYFAFWVPAHELVASVALPMLALIAAVVFWVGVSRGTGDAGALSIADGLFLTTLALLFLSLGQTIGAYHFARTGREDASHKLDVAARVLYPIVVAASFAFLIQGASRGG